MLAPLVESYLVLRRRCGFALKSEGNMLRSFAAFADAQGDAHVCGQTAIEWARLGRSAQQRARRLGHVIRLTRYARVENPAHELPPPIFGSEKGPRPVPYILSPEEIQRLVQAASALGHHAWYDTTYSTFFALLACTGLRLSEAIRLRFTDITPDGLVIRCTKFGKSRLVPLHETARAGLERYLVQRRLYAPFDDHVFVSLRRNPLSISSVECAFHRAARTAGLPRAPQRPRPTLHSLRHTFAVRALETCPDNRDHIMQHMVALSTYLGHGHVAHTYWYLEATPTLMRDIAERCERFVIGEQP